MTDASLVERTLNGSDEAFEELVRRHQGVVLGLAYHELGSFADAEDVAQQAFLAAYQRLDRLRDSSRFAGWLREIVRNECRMWRRRRRESAGFPEGEEEVPSPEDSPEEASVRRETQQRVRDAVAALSPANRLAVTLYYLDGQSCEEVAAFLGVSPGAVRTRLHRARNELRKEMMDMVAETLARRRPAAEFTEAVRRTMPKRVVEPFAFSVPLEPTDTVFVYVDEGVVDIRGTDDNRLKVRGKKVLWGATAEEARARSRQLVVHAGRKVNVWDAPPHEGERWAGTSASDDGQDYQAVYTDAGSEWEEWKTAWQQEPTLKTVLPDLLKGEVVCVVAAGNRIDGLTVPYPLKGQVKEDFRLGYASERGRAAFGAAAAVRLSLAVPPCANVVMFAPASVTVEGVAANLFLLGWYGSAAIRAVRGNVYACNLAPTRVEDVTGDLWVSDTQDHRGVEWEETRVRRLGKPPAVRIRRHTGAVRLRCRNLHLDLADVSGDIRIENDFGSTRLSLAGDWASSRTAEVESVTGRVSLILTAEADDKLKVGVWTECGVIDRGDWPTAFACYNTPHTIYLGTTPHNSPAHVRLRTRSGNVRVVRKE